jgi:hypothetical protein
MPIHPCASDTKISSGEASPGRARHCCAARSGLARDKPNVDIFWLRDDSLDDVGSLPPPDVIAAEIVKNVQAALQQFQSVADELS